MKMEIMPERDSFNTYAEPITLHGNKDSVQFNIDDRELVFDIKKLQTILSFMVSYHGDDND